MKERLDVLLVKQGFAPSREKAKAILMSGIVYVNGQKEDKAGTTFEEEKIQIEVRGKTLPYVSRGGLKLEKALAVFQPDLTDKVCLDIGASTGGFTDCMLQNKAAKVYAVDVGHGQLDYKLRTDPRVICMEGTNFRYMTKDSLPEQVSFAASDVAFISLTKMLPPAYELLEEDGQMVALVKPQFEAGRELVGKKGVVSDPAVHLDVIEKISAFAAECGFLIRGLDFSPIKGPEGNIEFLLWLQKCHGPQEMCLSKERMEEVVKNAQDALRH
ncbi:MAG: TlyA family RNA methyltransferase [Lachnospiraceae bacterium]|nr:TlyA family RNA methyltransferase [Lachnospiraceae bacterium]